MYLVILFGYWGEQMAFSIGLRFYQIRVVRRSDSQEMEIGPGALPVDFLEFANDFVERRQEATIEENIERTWFFNPQSTNSHRTIHGLIGYGTHGFESSIKDVRTRE